MLPHVEIFLQDYRRVSQWSLCAFCVDQQLQLSQSCLLVFFRACFWISPLSWRSEETNITAQLGHNQRTAVSMMQPSTLIHHSSHMGPVSQTAWFGFEAPYNACMRLRTGKDCIFSWAKFFRLCRNNTLDYGGTSSEDLLASVTWTSQAYFFNSQTWLEYVCICVQSFIYSHFMRNYDSLY